MKSHHLLLLIRNLNLKSLLDLSFRQIFYSRRIYLLGANLNSANGDVVPPIGALQFHRLSEDSILEILKELRKYDQPERIELLNRIIFFKNGLRNAFACSLNGNLTSIQWLVLPDENDVLQRHYRKKYRLLEETQVMLEHVYVFPQFRGLGLAQYMSLKLLKSAKDLGYKHAISYIKAKNFVSLNLFHAIGFRIFDSTNVCRVLGHEWRAFRTK